MDVTTNNLIEGKYLEVCSPEMAYQWLSSRVPKTSAYRNAPLLDLYDDYQEMILLDRNDPLIDYGLARYGWSGKVAEILYERLDHAGRCTMRAYHLAGGGTAQPLEKLAEFTDEAMRELTAWIYNPYLSDEFFEGFFNKAGIFERLPDDCYRTLIQLAGRNKRLSTPYETLYLDGFDEHLPTRYSLKRGR